MQTTAASPPPDLHAREPSRWYVIWFRALTRPTVATYRNLLLERKAGFGRAVLWILLAGVSGGLITRAIFPGLFHIDKNDLMANFSVDLTILGGGAVVFATYLLLQHAMARAQGGGGTLRQLAFISAAYTAPLILLSGALSGISGRLSGISYAWDIVAGVGFTTDSLPDVPAGFGIRNLLLAFALAGYSVIAVRAVHQMSTARALFTAALPTALNGCTVLGLTGLMWAEGLQSPSIYRGEQNAAIYVIGANGLDLSRLTDGRANDSFPVWSPDGTRIAFTSDRDGDLEIYVMNVDGSQQRRLTSDPGGDAVPAWSPDGMRIAWISDRDGNSNIYLMNADGTGRIRLTSHPAEDGDPAWSPDGKSIAFTSSRDEMGGIYLMNPDGSKQVALISWNANEGAPAWSPDGRRIAFSAWYEGLSRVYIMNADGSGPHSITAGVGNDMWPVWAPTGDRIAFISDRDSANGARNDEIYIMDLDGSNQVNLTNYLGEDGIPSWSPDGKYLAFASRRLVAPYP